MTAAVMTVVFAMGFQMPLHYPDMVTCQREAAMVASAKGDVISATCKEVQKLTKAKHFIPPKP